SSPIHMNMGKAASSQRVELDQVIVCKMKPIRVSEKSATKYRALPATRIRPMKIHNTSPRYRTNIKRRIPPVINSFMPLSSQDLSVFVMCIQIYADQHAQQISQ